ncbi:MAG: protein kinase [Nannocystaceae bacterium]
MGDADDTTIHAELPLPLIGDGPSESSLVQVVARQVRKRLFGGPGSTQMIGRYTVVDTIGEGGMGVVLRALDPRLDRQVALKVLRGQLSRDVEERLRREAQAMAKLSHPNVVQVYEVGDSDGRIFVAMELVDGQTLGEWMKQRHGWRQCVEVFVGLGEGLAAAHEQGLVHRDFKPANALIDAKGRPRVLDFGLARLTEVAETAVEVADASLASVRRALIVEGAVSASASLTKTGTIMGTPAYMSPEQYRGGVVDARSDQFSFCVTLYEALYGERPFRGRQLLAVMEAMVRGEVSPSPPRGHGVPRALRSILLRGMDADPDARFSSMDELLAALRRLVAPKQHRWITAGLVAGLLVTSGGLVASRYYGGGDDDAHGEPGPLLADECPDDPALALCLRFESVEGNVVRDDADPSIRGTLSGDATIGEGRLGKALVLPGEDGRITLETAIDPPGSLSIDAWMWMAEGSPVWAGIVDKWVPHHGYWFGGTSRPGGLAFWVDGISISTEAVPKEQWTHVAGTFDVDSGVMSLYIDGKLVALGQHDGPATPVDAPMVLGCAYRDDAPFKGKLDSIRIWNRVLEAHEIRRPRPTQ